MAENMVRHWSPPSAAYMCQWTRSELFQIMVCCPFGAKPLPEPMLAYCKVGTWEQISVELFETGKFYHFYSKMHLKLSSAKMANSLSKGRRVNWLVSLSREHIRSTATQTYLLLATGTTFWSDFYGICQPICNWDVVIYVYYLHVCYKD